MKVFLSYPHVSGVNAAVGAFHSRLQDELRLQKPEATIFLDTENIPPGSEFPQVLRSELDASDIFIPLLSPGVVLVLLVQAGVLGFCDST